MNMLSVEYRACSYAPRSNDMISHDSSQLVATENRLTSRRHLSDSTALSVAPPTLLRPVHSGRIHEMLANLCTTPLCDARSTIADVHYQRTSEGERSHTRAHAITLEELT